MTAQSGRRAPINPDNFVKVNKHLAEGKVLDLGSGDAHPHAEGPLDVTVDGDPKSGADVVTMIEDTLPFDDNQFENVTAIHFLEHLPGDNDVAIWEEMKRVASKRAIAIVPIGERDDPDHSHVYDRDEALERFDHTGWDTSTVPNGYFDIVLVAYV